MACLSSCDFFRKVAGRPTSAELQQKKEEIVRVEEQQAEQARLDSILAAQKAAEALALQQEQDSIQALEYLRAERCVLHNLSRMKGLKSGKLENRYYIIIGSFRDAANADRFIKKLGDDPRLQPTKIYFRTGMCAVGVCPQDRVKEVRESYEYVRTQDFCPKEAWILVNQH